MSEEKFSDDELRKCLSDLATHVGKFSHPHAKSKVVARPKGSNDGFLRSGNVKNVPDDFMGNANRSKKYAALFDMKSDYSSISPSLSIPKSTDTDEKNKQVYFPYADNDYHLLSILTPSGIIVQLQDRLKEEDSSIRKLIIKYGGTEPRNISYLNTKRVGKFNLLHTLPPHIDKNKVRLPKRDFFREVLCIPDYKEIFWGFYKKHKQLEHRSNVDIKTSRDDWVRDFFDKVMIKVWEVRSAEHNWSERDTYQNLPAHQKKWLDNKYRTERENGDFDSDLQKVAEEIARNFIRGCGNTVDDILGDDDLSKIKKLIDIDELR